jgi:hypothetical protein
MKKERERERERTQRRKIKCRAGKRERTINRENQVQRYK